MSLKQDFQLLLAFKSSRYDDTLSSKLIACFENLLPNHDPFASISHVELMIKRTCQQEKCQYCSLKTDRTQLLGRTSHWVSYGVTTDRRRMYRVVDKFEKSANRLSRYKFIGLECSTEELNVIEAFALSQSRGGFNYYISIWNFMLGCRYAFPMGVSNSKQLQAKSDLLPDPKTWICSEFTMAALCKSGIVKETVQPSCYTPKELLFYCVEHLKAEMCSSAIVQETKINITDAFAQL